MKECKNWWILEGQNIVGHYDQHEEELTKVVWRAALEWIRSRSVHRLISVNDVEEELGERR